MSGIYIHVPFCKHKCHYCTFYSLPYIREDMEYYISKILTEIELHQSDDARIESVYFGGGTPSLLSNEDFSKLISKIKGSFVVLEDAEITIEVNPESVTKEKALAWRQAGINRVSIGIQSFMQEELGKLGRVHDVSDIYQAIFDIKNAGISNISGDLICGLPKQTKEDWQANLEKIIKLDLEHISIYPLQIEENSEFGRSLDQETIDKLDDNMIELMQITHTYLENNGYLHYEIANYAKAGFESKHNLIYWKYKPYYGFGPAAASFDGKVRMQNSSSFAKWANGFSKEIDLASKDKKIQMAEYTFLALRLLRRGLVKSSFESKFGISFDSVYGKLIEELISYGWIIDLEDLYILSEEAMYFANQIFAEFLPD